MALRLTPEPSAERTKTFETDGTTLWYNPGFVDSCEVEEVVGCLAHTSLHPALLHHTRMGNRDKEKWNQATDHVVNDIILNSGFVLPQQLSIHHNKAYSGKTADEVYTLLPDPPKNNKGDKDGQKPGPGDVGPPNSPPSDQSSEGTDGGSSSTGEQEAEWKQALAQATAIAKQQGKMPAGMDRHVDDTLAAKQDWRELLRRFCTEQKPCPPKWNRPDKRYTAYDLYLPSKFKEETGTFVICIDTSGSIQEKELNEFGTEIRAILEDVRPERIYLLWADARVAGVQEFSPDDISDITFTPKGGGGTDFRPSFDWVKNKGLNPAAFVYMTDGYGPFPEVPPEYPTLWVINNKQVTPPWGEHVVLEVN